MTLYDVINEPYSGIFYSTYRNRPICAIKILNHEEYRGEYLYDIKVISFHWKTNSTDVFYYEVIPTSTDFMPAKYIKSTLNMRMRDKLQMKPNDSKIGILFDRIGK